MNQLAKNISKALGGFIFATASGLAAAQAAPGGAGGLSTAQTQASSIQVGLFALVGVVAGIYVLYTGVMAFTEKKTWSDFGWSIVHVVAVGASGALATWGWSLYS